MPKATKQKPASLYHVGVCSAAEMALLMPLIRGTDLDWEVVEQCTKRHFLPAHLYEPIIATAFIARTVAAARKAQDTYGVPACVLMSMAAYETSWDARSLVENLAIAIEWPGCGCCYSPEILRWFMELAAMLAESSRYRKAMKLLPDLQAYLRKVCSIGINYRTARRGQFKGDLDASDLLDYIQNYHLEECNTDMGWVE